VTVNENVNRWPVHDAVLRELVVDWKARICRAYLSVPFEPGKYAVPCVVVWSGVTHLNVPMRHPWGSSVFVNTLRIGSDGEYLLEMQSGDLVEIKAASALLERVTDAG
jgi:hypothetical protein